MAPHSSTLAWKIPWTEEPGRLQSMESRRVRHDWATFTFHFHALEKEMAPHSSVLAWRIPRTEEPGRLPSTGSHRVKHDWSDLPAAAAARHFAQKPLSLIDLWMQSLFFFPPFFFSFSGINLLKIFLYRRCFEVLVAQLCLTLCNPVDCSLPGSSVQGTLQARIVEWVAIPFYRGSSWPRDRT